jgi:hypothetical protein
MGMPKIFVATPTTNGLMLSAYVNSVVQMVTRLHAKGIATDYRTIDGYHLVMQRDMLADTFLKTDATHLLFIDSDMTFEPGLCERLLKCAKPVIGTIYAKRALDLGKLKEAVSAHGFDHGLALAHNWNVRFLGPRLDVQNGLCRVEGIGFGFTLIERAALLSLADDCPTYLAPNGKDTLRAFFRETSLEPGKVLDLDYSFCKRWIERRGEVWAYANARIQHIGDFAYGMPFSSYLAALQASQAAAPEPPTTTHVNGPPLASDASGAEPSTMPDAPPAATSRRDRLQ